MLHRPLTTLGAFVLLAAVATGCGSASTHTVTAAPSTSPPSTSPTTASPTTTTGPSGETTVKAHPDFTIGSVPVVSGAPDLRKEPKIHAGTAAAPKVLVGRDLVVGTGAQALPSSTVTVAYVGALYPTGKVFDASWTDGAGKPVSFPLSGVIPGFKDAIIGMRVGGRREIVIPPAYGYRNTASAAIPADSTLVFVIDLTKVS